jgi:hypothetical protein
MNFRQKFEAWHKKAYGYCNPPPPGFTAFHCVYPNRLQQARWEAWCASAEKDTVALVANAYYCCTCGYIRGEVKIEYAHINFPCPSCGRTMDKAVFIPLKKEEEDEKTKE